MKREEIIAKWDGMSARERDAWIAHVLFGWTGADVDTADFAYEAGLTGIDQYPSYTTDMSDAWIVWKSLLAEGCEPLINTTSSRSSNVRSGEVPEGWTHVCIHKDDVNYHVSIKEAPEAIGLAAIIAKLSTEE
ncbi:hypothetical protein [Paenibacillus sp. FSL R5-0519]|uniref:BC1872 family protein n=1 Tax=Paenibacillus sp. FSL R5-0519 TaxID=2921648 RepID=UPI0030D74CCB